MTRQYLIAEISMVEITAAKQVLDDAQAWAFAVCTSLLGVLVFCAVVKQFFTKL